MSVIRAQISIPSQTGLPEDTSMNVWHFATDQEEVADEAASIHTALEIFYDSIAAIYSTNTITSAWTAKYFDLSDIPPRSPILEDTMTIAGLGTGDALPTECAITMSFQGEPESGINQQRRRGRIYLGPLDGGVASTAAGVVKVVTAVTEDIAAAATTLRDTGGLLSWVWVVFSPTSAGSPPWDNTTLAASIAIVDNGWIDNAFDTQRRRGTTADAREVWN